MRSISARLTGLYAISFLVLSAATLAIGYRQIDQKLVRGLDTLLNTERQRVFNHLALGEPSSDPQAIRSKLQRSSDNSAVLFSVEIRSQQGATLFRSSNLRQRLAVPDHGWTYRTLSLPDGTGLRVARFDYGRLITLIATPTQNVDAAMRGYIESSLSLLVAMVLASITIGYVLSQLALRPLREIAATAGRIRPDNLAERISIRSVDREVSELARLLNAMLDRIEGSFHQIRQFTADASHELKTPLALLRLNAETLVADPALSPGHENAIVAQLDQIDRLSKMVDELLLLARADSQSMVLDLVTHDPERFLTGLMGDAMVLAEAHGCEIRLSHEGSGNATFDARWIRQIVFNLLSNALRAAPEHSTVALRSELMPRSWTVTVIDSGPGVDDAQRARMFDRFYTGADGGTGLGLAICRSIVELHGGTIAAEAGANGRGLSMTFKIPRFPPQV